MRWSMVVMLAGCPTKDDAALDDTATAVPPPDLDEIGWSCLDTSDDTTCTEVVFTIGDGTADYSEWDSLAWEFSDGSDETGETASWVVPDDATDPAIWYELTLTGSDANAAAAQVKTLTFDFDLWATDEAFRTVWLTGQAYSGTLPGCAMRSQFIGGCFNSSWDYDVEIRQEASDVDPVAWAYDTTSTSPVEHDGGDIDITDIVHTPNVKVNIYYTLGTDGEDYRVLGRKDGGSGTLTKCWEVICDAPLVINPLLACP